MPLLSLEKIGHDFQEEGVLDDVSLELPEGTAWAVVGPNGAGKTTLIRIAAGLLDPVHGSVSLEGDPIDGLTRREIARRVSVLRQMPPRTFGFTALEVVLMGFHARSGRFSLSSDRQRERALAAMRRLEVDELAERPAPALSGGELQRVLMARTLVSETRIWLLDEPTAHLDVRHRLALLDEMARHRDEGGAVLAAVHDLSLVPRYFDGVVMLDDGRAAASGPVGETLDEEHVSEVFGVEMRRGAVDGRSVWISVAD